MKALLRIGLPALALAGVLFFSLPFTEAGTRWLSQAVQRFTPLEIEHRSGSLASYLELSRLAYRSDRVLVELLDVSAQMDLECLWRSVFCFTRLDVGDLAIDIQAAEAAWEGAGAPGPGDPAAQSGFTFPVGAESGMLQVARTHIRWPGGEWRQGRALLRSVSLRGSLIAIENAEMASTSLVIEPLEDDDALTGGRLQLPELSLPFTLSLGALSLRNPRWEVPGLLLEHDSLALSGKWRGTSLSLSGLEAVSRDIGQLSAELLAEFAGDWRVSGAGQLVLTGKRRVAGFPGGPVAIDLSGRLSSLSASVSSQGDREFRLEIDADLLHRSLPFSANLEVVSSEPLPLSQLPGVPTQLAGLTLQFPWRAEADGSLERQRVAVRGAFSGGGYSSLELDAEGDRLGNTILLEKLSLRDARGDSRVHAAGEIVLGDQALLSLSLETPGLTLPDVSPAAVGRLQGALAAEAALGRERWQVRLSDIDLTGDINGLAAGASGTFFFDQGWSLGDSDLKASVNGADLRLLGTADGSREGRLEVAVDDIGLWQPGSLGKLEILGRVDPGARRIQLTGGMENFSRGNIRTDKILLAGRYAVDGNAFDLSLESAALSVAGAQLTGVSITGTGDDRHQTIVLTSGGDVRGEATLSGTGWGEQWRGLLAPVEIQTTHGDWVTEKSVALAWTAGQRQLAVAPHCWLRGAASFCVDGLRLGSAGQLRVAANGDLAEFSGLLPTDMEVRGAAELLLSGSWNEEGELLFEGRSRIDSTVVTRHYGEDESASVSWDRGEAQLRFDGTALSAQSYLVREGRRILDLDIQFPVSKDLPIAGRVTVAQLQLEPLIAFMPALSQLHGEVSGKLTIAGTRDKPLATGELRLSGAGVAVAGNPTRLEALELLVALKGERAGLAGSGLLGGGKVRLEGELDLKPDWELRLQVTGARQAVLYPPATELLLSEQLTIKATRHLLSVSGDVTVHEGSLEPEQLPQGSVAISPHVVEVDYQGNVLRKQLPFDISLDVRVVVEERFRIRSNILFATLGGELRVSQRPGQPLQLFGTLRVVDGHVVAYRQKLQIQRGVFNFSGRPDNPAINVRAVRNISGSNVVAGLQIQGTYDAMALEIFSEPAMSEGEAMSYLVRGRGLDSAAGEDSTALALSVASDVLNRTTLVSELNRIPGVSNVSFGAEGSEDDTAATVSGFIGERIFLAYGIGVYEPINVLIARLFIRTRLWLEVVSRLENSVDLYYAFDID